MNVGNEKYLVSLSSPLELTIACKLNSLSKADLGTGVQQHINMLRSRGFEPKWIMVDPQKLLSSLVGAFSEHRD